MSTTLISERFTIGGVLTDMTSVVLRDPTAAYGVKRTDTDAVVVAAGTALVKQSTGIYEYSFTDPAAGLTYNYWIEFVYSGQTFRVEKDLSAPADAAAGSSYLTLAEAVALAATLPGLTKFKAASGADQTAALLLATRDIDDAGPYQGRKFDLTQVLEFPRAAYSEQIPVGQYGVSPAGVPLQYPFAQALADVIWDWDSTAEAAIVPAIVKQACLFQADAILDGSLASMLDSLAAGIQSQAAGSVSVTYRDPVAIAAMLGGSTGGLCRRSAQMMKRYLLRSGRML